MHPGLAPRKRLFPHCWVVDHAAVERRSGETRAVGQRARAGGSLEEEVLAHAALEVGQHLWHAGGGR